MNFVIVLFSLIWTYSGFMVDANLCPDQKSQCPDETTCCEMSSGAWGCCPMPNAVCCSDKIHCCPEDTTCDVQAGKCQKRTSSTSTLLSLIFVARAVFEPNDLICNKTSKESCPDRSTCCQMPSGDWGCCPMPKAVCCDDKIHCCPQSTTCNVAEQKCVHASNGLTISWFEKFPTRKNIQVNDVQCDPQTACPDESTCCTLESGDWGCCPMINAVCCDDKVHCCPEGTMCNLQTGTCQQRSSRREFPWFKSISPSKQVKATDVQCDQETACPDETTCCKLDSGDWGCCPMPNAVCCDDKIHCCPQGTTCNVQQGSCEQGSSGMAFPWFRKVSTTKFVKSTSNDILCPDPAKKCADGDTCCKQGNPPTWACCPLPHATCCPDGLHCCPSGAKCNNESKCESSGVLTTIPAISMKKSNDNVPLYPKTINLECPDHTTVCHGDNVTCCLMSDETYGCCAIPNAVCCANKRFCCPAGTTCSLIRDRCYRSNNLVVNGTTIKRSTYQKPRRLPNVPLFRITADNFIPEAKFHTCQGGASQCMVGTTCCITDSSSGCCPHTNGMCCADGTHCCPMGTTCDASSSKCTKRNGIKFDWSAIISTPVSNRNQCPNNDQSCINGGKCCRNVFGDYSCCPDPQGVCCSNGQSCCPKGYVCGQDGACSAVIDDN